MTSPGLAMTPRGEVARLGEKRVCFSEFSFFAFEASNSPLDLARAR